MIYLLTVSLLILVILATMAIVKSKFNIILTATIIPFLIFNAGFSWHTISELRGSPRDGYPVGQVQLLYAAVQQPKIYLLVNHENEKSPTLYAIPYSEEDARKLAKAMGDIKDGQTVMARLQNKDHGNNSNDQEMIYYRFNHEEQMPKDTPQRSTK